MSELIAMRQRIKAIQTIKKITEAMRLIALSTQIRVKSSTSSLHTYVHELQQLSQRILNSHEHLHNPILNPPANNQKLIILIGSQKGLCGTFNTQLSYFFESMLEKEEHNVQLSLIIVGKKIIELVEKNHHPIFQSFPELSPHKAPSVARVISEHIWHAQPSYSQVTVVFNNLKRGLSSTPEHINIIPFNVAHEHKPEQLEPYFWAQDQEMIIKKIFHTLLTTRLQGFLFSSLLAEQMARFTSMHRATKNASDLLDTMRINYNKLRQAKITRELTDLTASF